MPDKLNIIFTTKVSEQDWDKGLRAWHCSALKIPGAVLESILVSGKNVSTSSYQIDYNQNLVRWTDSEKHPSQAVFQIKLTKELSTEEKTSKWKKLAVILPAITALVVALIPYLLNVNWKRETENPNCTEKVRIVVPNANETVSIPVTVRGTYKDLPPAHKIYVAVESAEAEKLYPQTNPVAMQSDNTWSTDILVGVAGDVGGTFRIHALLANVDAQGALDLYINEAKQSSHSPGWFNLPKGAAVCSTIRVQRSAQKDDPPIP